MFIKENILNTSGYFFHDQIELIVPDYLSYKELEETSSIYTEWLINDPCSNCSCNDGLQYNRNALWLESRKPQPGAKILLAKEFDQVAGFAQFFVDSSNFPGFASDIPDRFARLGKLAYLSLALVRPDYQERGLEKKMFERVLNECKNNSCNTLVIEIFACPIPDSPAIEFYQELGFVHSGQSDSHLRKIGKKIIPFMYTQLYRELF